MTSAETDIGSRGGLRPRWLRPAALMVAIILHAGAVSFMTIPRPALVAGEDSIEVTLAQGTPDAEPEPPALPPPPPPEEPPPPPPPEEPPPPPPPPLDPPPPPPPEPPDEPPPPEIEPPKREVAEAPAMVVKPKPKPLPPKPRPPDPQAPPPEPKAPGADQAEADRARAQATYASKLLAEIRRHKPSVTMTGSVVVSFAVGSGGEMTGVTVVRSSGKDALDRAAVSMVRAAHPEPPPDGHFSGTTTINFVDN